MELECHWSLQEAERKAHLMLPIPKLNQTEICPSPTHSVGLVGVTYLEVEKQCTKKRSTTKPAVLLYTRKVAHNL